MNKNLTLQAGHCHHRKDLPHPFDLVRSGVLDPPAILTKQEPLTNVLAAYGAFDQRQPGWIKVKLEPQAA